MSTLPDIDTTNVSGISFYNVKDEQGVSDANFDPMDFSTWSALNDVQIYDNGIDAKIDRVVYFGDGNARTKTTGRFRCKNDGWVIIWSPTRDAYFGASEFIDGTVLPLLGSYNFYGAGITESESQPFLWLKMLDALSHAGYGVSVPPGETVLGHYNYKATDASNITHLTTNSNLQFSFTSSVDRKFHYVTTSAYSGDLIKDSDSNYVIETDSTVSNSSNSTGAVLDALNEQGQGFNFLSSISPGVTYQIDGNMAVVSVSAWS